MTAARWTVMTATLLGQPVPPPPLLPGRVHLALDTAPLPPTDAEVQAARVWVELASYCDDDL